MNGKTSADGFIQKIEQRIKEVKESEELRREYMLINSFERDARHEGWKAGIAQGISQGRSEGIAQGMQAGIAQGSYQTKLETAKNLFGLGLSIENIAQATGLSQAEVEAIK